MSVILRGMKMPANCDVCPLDSGVDCMVYPPSAEIVYDIADGKPAWCPLIEIPLHGDLIDADKLVELCDIMANECVNKCDGIGATIWHQFKATVEWSPIVIPAEEGEDG